MKNVAEWKFSAPVADVDLPRIMKEAEDSCQGRAHGVVRVTLANAVILLVNDVLRYARFDLARPLGYLSTVTKVTKDAEIGLTELENSVRFAPDGAVAVYIFRGPSAANEADALLGQILDRVEVNVEVF